MSSVIESIPSASLCFVLPSSLLLIVFVATKPLISLGYKNSRLRSDKISTTVPQTSPSKNKFQNRALSGAFILFVPRERGDCVRRANIFLRTVKWVTKYPKQLPGRPLLEDNPKFDFLSRSFRSSARATPPGTNVSRLHAVTPLMIYIGKYACLFDIS